MIITIICFHYKITWKIQKKEKKRNITYNPTTKRCLLKALHSIFSSIVFLVYNASIPKWVKLCLYIV